LNDAVSNASSCSIRQERGNSHSNRWSGRCPNRIAPETLRSANSPRDFTTELCQCMHFIILKRTHP
jgi:hypothetical protein